MKNPRAALAAGSRAGAAAGMTAPVVVGGVRNLSLWGYGWPRKTKQPEAEPATTTPEPVVDTQSPIAETSVAAPAPAPAPVEPVIADPPPAVDSATLFPELDLTNIADLASGESILNMPEDVGFLANLGLDYGWGPTSVMQTVLEHVHVYTGLGWGGTIIATALALRVVMFYPQIRSMRFSAQMNELKNDPRSKEALALIQKGYMTGDREQVQKGQFLNKMVRQEHNASSTGMLWAFVQIPFSFGLFRILSGMAHIPVPSMETGGYLWFTDLTASDPYFILPALGSSLLFGAMLVSLPSPDTS